MAGKKLLVADDSLTIQKVIRLALSNEGYDIQAVSDGNDAIQQISLFRPDVVLIDVSLPGKSAFEVKRTINQQGDFEHVCFVLMSSAFEKVDEEQASQVVFHGRLTKPFDPAHLRQVLTDVLSASNASEEATVSELPSDLIRATDDDFAETPPMIPTPSDDSHADADSGSLWNAEEKQKMDDPFSHLAPPPLPGAASTTDSDIRNLTESTIRMSGLDDYQWSINETARKEDFGITPPPSMSDLGGATFRFDQEDRQIGAHDESDDESGQIVHGAQVPVTPGNHSEPSFIPPPPPQLAPGQGNMSAAGMEAMIQTQLQETIERMLQKLLPEVAERVIKQEINRMLQDTP